MEFGGIVFCGERIHDIGNSGLRPAIVTKKKNLLADPFFFHLDFSVISAITPLGFLLLDGSASSTSISRYISRYSRYPMIFKTEFGRVGYRNNVG